MNALLDNWDELLQGERIGCAAAGRIAGKLNGGKPINPATITRWAKANSDGIALPHDRVGRTIVTTEAALRWYFRELARAAAFRERSPWNADVPTGEEDTDIDAALDAEGL